MEDEDNIADSICLGYQRSLSNTNRMNNKLESKPAMEVADRPIDNLVYSTPLIQRPEIHSWSVQTAVSNDSGFSDRNFNLTGESNTTDAADFGSPLFSKSGGLLSSPEKNFSNGRRSTLTDCEFSPVQETTSIRGRRLLFKAFDTRPPALQLPLEDFDSLEMNELSSFSDCKSNITKEIKDTDLGTCNMKISSSAEQSNKISLNKCNEDSSYAGSSLSGSTDDLEFSLQEMSLEEMTSSWSSGSRTSPFSLKPSSSQDSLSDNKIMMLSDEERQYIGSESCLKEHYNPCFQTCESRKNNFSSDGRFKEAQSESSLYLDHTYFKYNASAAGPSLNHNLTVCVEHLDSQSTTNRRIPPLPSEYNFLTSDTVVCFPREQPLLKSPNKRHSSEFEYDLSVMHSPTKCKRTLDDNARARSVAEQLQNGKVCTFTSISGDKLFPECKATGDTFHDEKQSRRDFDMTAFSSGDAMCAILDSDKLCSSKDSCDSLSDITQQGILIKTADSVLSSQRFKKIIQSFSPSEPSRLIGRNVGVRKLDIVQKLSQNFSQILGSVFHHLDPSDLDSVCQVNSVWKKALYNDKKAYDRYKMFREATRSALQEKGHGKENCGEKLLSGPLAQNLTTSKGHLTCMQTQAQKIESKPQPAVLEPSFSLRSGDQLRRCPHCQGSAVVQPNQDRAICIDVKCGYDFCTQCFAAFHHPKRCKPLCRASSVAAVAGTRKSKKNLKRL